MPSRWRLPSRAPGQWINDALLHQAIEAGDFEVIHTAVRAGGNPNSANNDGELCLEMAYWNTQGNAIAIVEELLLSGANPSIPNCTGNSFLHSVAEHLSGAQLGAHEENPFHALSVIEMLRLHGADFTKSNPAGATAFQVCIQGLKKQQLSFPQATNRHVRLTEMIIEGFILAELTPADRATLDCLQFGNPENLPP